MASVLNLPGIAAFDLKTDSTSLAPEWEKWTGRFKTYLAATGVTNAPQKRALLLHLAGPEVQDVFVTLEGTGEDDDFGSALKSLTD